MQNNSDPFEHASHNLKACNKLNDIGGFEDWVITTAFYSGMKFLQAKLFPGIYEHPRKFGEEREFKNFAQYIAFFGRLEKTNKHREMSKFVEKYVNDEDVINSYEDLKQSCHTARYINYQVGSERKEMALKGIETIKNYCIQ